MPPKNLEAAPANFEIDPVIYFQDPSLEGLPDASFEGEVAVSGLKNHAIEEIEESKLTNLSDFSTSTTKAKVVFSSREKETQKARATSVYSTHTKKGTALLFAQQATTKKGGGTPWGICLCGCKRQARMYDCSLGGAI